MGDGFLEIGASMGDVTEGVEDGYWEGMDSGEQMVFSLVIHNMLYHTKFNRTYCF